MCAAAAVDCARDVFVISDQCLFLFSPYFLLG